MKLQKAVQRYMCNFFGLQTSIHKVCLFCCINVSLHKCTKNLDIHTLKSVRKNALFRDKNSSIWRVEVRIDRLRIVHDDNHTV